MGSRTWLNLGLLAAAGVLGLVAIVQPWQSAPPPREPLTELDPGALQRVVLVRDGDTIVLNHGEAGWTLKQPRALPADASRVQSVTEIAQAKIDARYSVDELNLGDLDLDPPLARLTLDDHTIRFGAKHPIEEKRYVQVGETVALIAANHFRHVQRGYTGFVNRSLLPEGSALTGLTLPDFELHREDPHWQVEPAEPEVSADAVQRFLDAWRNAEALRVTEGEHDGQSQGTIEVTLGDRQAPIRFHIIERKPQLVLARPDWNLRYHLSRYNAERLLTRPGSSQPTPEAATPSNSD